MFLTSVFNDNLGLTHSNLLFLKHHLLLYMSISETHVCYKHKSTFAAVTPHLRHALLVRIEIYSSKNVYMPHTVAVSLVWNIELEKDTFGVIN